MRVLFLAVLALCAACTEPNPAFRDTPDSGSISRGTGGDTALGTGGSGPAGQAGAAGAGGTLGGQDAGGGARGVDSGSDALGPLPDGGGTSDTGDGGAQCAGCWKNGKCMPGVTDPSGMACGTGGGACDECPVVCIPGTGCGGAMMAMRSACVEGRCNLARVDVDRAERFCCATCKGTPTTEAWPVCESPVVP